MFSENPDIQPSGISPAFMVSGFSEGEVRVIGQGAWSGFGILPKTLMPVRELSGPNKVLFVGTDIGPGDSGGGVFDKNGRLVGLVHGRPVSTSGGPLEEFVTASSSRRIIDFLSANNINYSVSETMRCAFVVAS